MASVEQKIEKIRDSWFIEDPIYFMAQSVFRITLCDSVLKVSATPRHIYVNREFAESLSYNELEGVLKVELLRVLLRHPFTRFTSGCDKVVAYIASQMVISVIGRIPGVKLVDYDDFFKINKLGAPETNNGYMHEYKNYSYEEFYRKISHAMRDKKFDLKTIVGDFMASSYEEIMSATQYWGDDIVSLSDARRVIEHIGTTGSAKGVGSIPGSAIERIMADDPPCYDYKEPLRRFRHSVVCSAKRKTRTRPSRRYGYEQMGSIAEYTSNVLVVCDTSGSMNANELAKFLGFINGFLSSGLSSIDCIQFDTHVIDDTLEKLKRKVYNYNFSGRGGTDIQDIIKYVSTRSKKKYDGVIVYTDGGFSIDKEMWDIYLRNTKTRFVFCVTEEKLFEDHRKTMDGVPNIEFTYLDLNNKWSS